MSAPTPSPHLANRGAPLPSLWMRFTMSASFLSCALGLFPFLLIGLLLRAVFHPFAAAYDWWTAPRKSKKSKKAKRVTPAAGYANGYANGLANGTVVPNGAVPNGAALNGNGAVAPTITHTKPSSSPEPKSRNFSSAAASLANYPLLAPENGRRSRTSTPTSVLSSASSGQSASAELAADWRRRPSA